ncbi:MAG TPA: hypothetical protein VFO49_01030 [Nocardioides sp.]|nr:hypothetical protein [Nocardioides sp.]
MSRTFFAAFVTCVLLVVAPAPAGAIEDYPRYQPATKCSPKAKPGTKQLGRWLVRKYGGGFGPISRRCGGSRSEHTEGRAFDWTLNAARKADRRRAKAFLDRAFATDARGNTDAIARRMGIMYIIWNDRMYSAWDRYDAEPYLSSSCPSKKKCSKTLRHRDHMHISLTRRAARAETSWYK